MLRVIVVGALIVLAVLAAARWLSGKSEETSNAVSSGITTPIGRAARVEAEANVRSAMSAVQLYLAEHGTYAGISTQALRAIDAGVSPTVRVIATGTGYCLTATSRGVSVRNTGPAAGIIDGSC